MSHNGFTTGAQAGDYQGKARELAAGGRGVQAGADDYVGERFYAFPEDRDKFCGLPPYYVIYNPLAINPLSQPWLPGGIEYAVTEFETHTLQLTQLA